MFRVLWLTDLHLNFLTAADRDDWLASLAREEASAVIISGDIGEALDLVREQLRKNAQFRPAGSADLLALVHLSRAAGDRATARLLLQDFSKLYPGDPAQPVVDRLNTHLQ